MVRTPHYYRNAFGRPEAQMLFFRAVADQTRIPVVIYNSPRTTGVDIPAEAVAALSEHPNIIGIQESSGNLEKVMQMVRERRAGLSGLAHRFALTLRWLVPASCSPCCPACKVSHDGGPPVSGLPRCPSVRLQSVAVAFALPVLAEVARVPGRGTLDAGLSSKVREVIRSPWSYSRGGQIHPPSEGSRA